MTMAAVAAVLVATSATETVAGDRVSEIVPAKKWSLTVNDTLSKLVDASADAQEALDGLRWTAAEFNVSSTPLDRATDEADSLIRFPSPLPCGIEQCDIATLHWYAALDQDGNPISAPAVVVIHESGSRQTIGRLFARAFRDKGIHAFLLSLPNYGPRRSNVTPGTAESLLIRMKQGIADARRAKDVVASIPCIDSEHIGLQGISLGGFVASTTAGLDPAYHSVFIMLAGGDLAGIILKGGDVAAKVRARLKDMGVSEADVQKLAWPVEPLRVAHRLRPERTWVYTASHDQIIPAENAKKLVDAAKLDKNHQVMLTADHYTGVIYYPLLLNQMIEQLRKP